MHYLITDRVTSLDALAGLLGSTLGPLHRFESTYLGGNAARGGGTLIRPNVDMLTGGPYRPESPEARYVIEFDQPPTNDLLDALSATLRDARIEFQFIDDPATT